MDVQGVPLLSVSVVKLREMVNPQEEGSWFLRKMNLDQYAVVDSGFCPSFRKVSSDTGGCWRGEKKGNLVCQH